MRIFNNKIFKSSRFPSKPIKCFLKSRKLIILNSYAISRFKKFKHPLIPLPQLEKIAEKESQGVVTHIFIKIVFNQFIFNLSFHLTHNCLFYIFIFFRIKFLFYVFIFIFIFLKLFLGVRN